MNCRNPHGFSHLNEQLSQIGHAIQLGMKTVLAEFGDARRIVSRSQGIGRFADAAFSP